MNSDKIQGIAALVLSHGFSLGVGFYDGYNNKETFLLYPFLVTTSGTSIAYPFLDPDKKILDNLIAGAAMGGITSPIEYFLGSVIGTFAGYAFRS